MRQFVLSVAFGAVIALGASNGTLAAPFSGIGPSAHSVNVQRADYYHNHHHYRHREWDREHHRWNYHD